VDRERRAQQQKEEQRRPSTDEWNISTEGSRHEPQEVDAVDVYIVTIGVPVAVFRAHLVDVEGAQLVRELPPRRIVVALRSPADRQRLAALPGVEAVVPDRLEHPDQLA
jgi:hypothetical protein